MNDVLTFQTGPPVALTAQDTSQSRGTILRPNNNSQSAPLSWSIESKLGR
jgi:hypothetical protein